jgi:hypothetical protein
MPSKVRRTKETDRLIMEFVEELRSYINARNIIGKESTEIEYSVAAGKELDRLEEALPEAFACAVDALLGGKP